MKKQTKVQALVACAALLGGTFALANPIIIQSKPVQVVGQGSQNDGFLPMPVIEDTPLSDAQVTSSGDLQLMQEVMELRGLVEQLQHQVEELQNQNKERYIDLDGRIADLYQQMQGLNEKEQAQQTRQTTLSKQQNNEQKALYDQARELMNNRQYDQAVIAFQQYLSKYPNEALAPNCQYWLGEIFMVQRDYAKAELAFAAVIKNYPANNKSADATYKLGDLYQKVGRIEEAKLMFEAVVKKYGSTTTGRLAKRKLDAM